MPNSNLRQAALLFLLLFTSSVFSLQCQAQLGAGNNSNDVARFADSVTQRWQVGAVIKAGARGASSVNVLIPVPTDWPEQTVSVVEEDISSSVRNVKYQTLDGSVRCMTATIPRIGPQGAIKVTVTFEVQVRPINLPENALELLKPKKVKREIKQYLNASRLINHRKTDIKKLTKQLVQGKETAWEQTKSFYDWIQTNIATIADEEPKGAVIALKRKSGNDEDKVNLFIAMCRSFKVPARFVWADGLEYAEFYLEDAEGNGAWYPCQPGINPEFGQMTNPRVIQQKGDNIKVPGGKRKRFVLELVTGKIRGAQPEVIFVRRLVPH